MKIYGYSNNTEQEPMELSEVTLSTCPDTLRELSQFFLKCAEEIESNKEQWDHEHFTSKNIYESESPQLIVFNEKTMNE